MNYLATLGAGRYALWCYFIWWAVVAVRYFDPSPAIWITALGLSGIIGAALIINSTSSGKGGPDRWATFRFFLTPFCVSSFAALVKGKGFMLVFSPDWREMAVAGGLCLLLGAAALGARRLRRRGPSGSADSKAL